MTPVARAWARLGVLLIAAGLAAACGERRDISEMAVNLTPFDELRGLNILELRAGQVRAVRRNIERAPQQGYRERIGEWEVVFTVPGYDGSADESWPREDVQILELVATQQQSADSAAERSWREAATRVHNTTGATPHCFALRQPEGVQHAVEFDRGGDWRLTLAYMPAQQEADAAPRAPRLTVALRRASIRTDEPEECPLP